MLVTLLGLAIVIIAAIYIAWPLLQPPVTSDGLPDRSTDREAMQREKESALAAIAEVDFDHRVGKMTEEDHASLRAGLEARALRALAALDETAPEGSSDGTSGTSGFCGACGLELAASARYCSGCGTERSP